MSKHRCSLSSLPRWAGLRSEVCVCVYLYGIICRLRRYRGECVSARCTHYRQASTFQDTTSRRNCWRLCGGLQSVRALSLVFFGNYTALISIQKNSMPISFASGGLALAKLLPRVAIKSRDFWRNISIITFIENCVLLPTWELAVFLPT